MTLFWFLAGFSSALAVLAMLSMWPRARALCERLVATPRRAAAVAAVLVAAIAGCYGLAGRPPLATLVTQGNPVPSETEGSAASFAAAAKILSGSAGSAPSMGAVNAGSGDRLTSSPNAGSMETAIANLEARLSKGGGTAGDWELLAKSYEFLGRSAAAAQARAHQLPPPGTLSRASGEAASSVGAAVDGEVLLDASLTGKVTAGETLFIVAKSVDSPGIPVAVIRASVGKWPVQFRLDDSQSMMPGHGLSSAGRVIVEARISHTGQPMPVRGDLQGSSQTIDPAEHKALTILIDRVIS